MQRAEFTDLSNHLCRLEKNLARILTLQAKGCAVDGSLNDIYAELTDIGNYLKKEPVGISIKEDGELGQTIERHRYLLEKIVSTSNNGKFMAEGMVLASESTLPHFFYHITSHYQGMWKFFEGITTIFGYGIIVFTLIIITYFSSLGSILILLIQFNERGISGINSLGFVGGVILGLCVHEFAHGIVLANNGIKIKRVGLIAGNIVGGFIEADEATFFQAEPKVHLRFNASSIGTNALVAVILGLIGILTSFDLLIFIALGDLFFGFINSLPISPLDGGWVYEDLINMYVVNKKVKGIFLSARFVIFLLWVILFTYSVLFNFA